MAYDVSAVACGRRMATSFLPGGKICRSQAARRD